MANFNCEIIFRGKIIDNGKWEYGSLISYDNAEKYIITKENLGHGLGYGYYEGEVSQVLPETVGQYTGLTDRDGEKIFNGDIVRYWSQGLVGQGCIKKRVDGLWFIYSAWQNQMWNLCPNQYGETTVEIVGNIHDNPEMLGGD